MARALRLVIFLVPCGLAVSVSLLAVELWPPEDAGINRWSWWAIVAATSTFVLVGTDRAARRLLPLTALLKMTLIFPDRAPSRFGLALRTGTTKQLERIAQQRDRTSPSSLNDGELMLELVAALGVHDRLTRGHCERVRAYTDLVIQEMRLPERDANLLRWAALLHDVGKLRVPREILTSDERPTDDEWEILATHPAEGMALTAPLAGWLGEWRRAIGEHHERWDGGGYPAGLSREQIHLGARIVAVTDAFDVMTSARSYKKPIPAAAARIEIARCSATQFDPAVVRAFLNVGLGPLRLALGPLAWFSNLPFLGQTPIITAAANTFSALTTATVLTVATVTVAPTAPTGAPPVTAMNTAMDTAMVTTMTGADVVADDAAITGPQGAPLIIAVTGSAEQIVALEIASAPAHGEALVSRQPTSVDGHRWQGEIVVTPDAAYVGRDELTYDACDVHGTCDAGVVGIELVAASSAAPTPTVTTSTPGPTTSSVIDTTALPATTAPATETSPPAAASTITTTSAPAVGQAPPDPTSTVTATVPPPASTAPGTTSPSASTTVASTTTSSTTSTTTTSSTTTTTTTTTTTIPATAPSAAADAATGTEDVTAVIAFVDLLANDTDANGDALDVTAVHDAVHGTVQMTSSHAVFVPDDDFAGTASFVYTVCDPGNLCGDAAVSVDLQPAPDAPEPADDAFSAAEQTTLVVVAPGVLANDVDADGDALGVNPASATGFSGTMTIAADGSLQYDPPPAFTGQDTGTYEVCDASALCSWATIVVDVVPTPHTTEQLYFTSATGPSGAFTLTTSAPAVANPEPDPPGGDNDPGLTLQHGMVPGLVWTRQVTDGSLDGAVTVDLFSTVHDFNSNPATLEAELFACNSFGLLCVPLLDQQWTFNPWNVGGAAAWTERQLVIGTLHVTLVAGSQIRLELTAVDRDLWIAMSGDRPSALELTH